MTKKIFITILMGITIIGILNAGEVLVIKKELNTALSSPPNSITVILYADAEMTTVLADEVFYGSTAIGPGKPIYKAENVSIYIPTPGNCHFQTVTRFTCEFDDTDKLPLDSVPYFTIDYGTATTCVQIDQDDWENFCNKKDVALPGTIIPWPAMTIPQGYLSANGSIVSIKDYPKLFAVIGTTFGGDGITNFGLPNLDSGLFIRGIGGKSNALGIVQNDALQDHVHGGVPTMGGGQIWAGGTPYCIGNTTGVVNARIADETRPINLKFSSMG